jgi:hypothetical protein
VDAVVPIGQPFDVIFSMTNLEVDPTSGFPMPAMDDLDFTIEVRVSEAFLEPGRNTCFSQGNPLSATSDPPTPLVIQLDDAWSPAADEPSSFRQVFRITPGSPASAYSITVSAVGTDGLSSRACSVTTCIETVDTGDAPHPWAEFVDPVKFGDGGEILPFDLLVHRNGYDPTHPLRVVVVPVNESDPIDIFPVSPADLTDFTRGQLVTQEDELVRFTCHCHFPCYVGAANAYLVRLIDSVTGEYLWWSEHVGRALVDRAPLALVELVEITDASGNGTLEACEAAQVHVRLIGRNPFANAAMDDMRLDLPLPPGVTVASWSLHFHDNPMDAVLPLPADLVATGTVTPGPTNFIVDTSRVAWRYETVSSHPPVFKDMFEAELLLDVAADALGAPGSLEFAGFQVSGIAATIPRSEIAPTLAIPIGPGPAPAEVSPLGQPPLLLRPDKQTLTWDGSAAALFNVYRGEIAALPRYGDCIQPRVALPSFTDADPLPASGSVFYLVAGARCGAEGSLGSDSLGAARIPGSRCP